MSKQSIAKILFCQKPNSIFTKNFLKTGAEIWYKGLKIIFVHIENP
jgi:hypothetical protein